jgi:hypothetical protein
MRPAAHSCYKGSRLRKLRPPGRSCKLRINPDNPTQTSLTLLLDGDAGDDMVNPTT